MFIVTYQVFTAHGSIAGAKWEDRIKKVRTNNAALKLAAKIKAEGKSRRHVKIYFALPIA